MTDRLYILAALAGIAAGLLVAATL